MMKMKYILLIAAAMFTFGAPMADAAPKKSKKAKAAKKAAADDFDIFSPSEADEAEAAKDAKDAEAAKAAAEEAERIASMSGAERREENKMLMEETKWYISNQKKTLKILRSVRNEKSAAKAVKPLEKIYGEVEDVDASGTVTALGTVKIMEEEEEKLPVHQASRATAAALNKAINKELTRIGALGIEHKKFNGVIKNMIDQQR
ncbi:MAG: hypothetical protein IJX33_06855 [Akkermansia sp.]|nr:hypothetical protein [Akkermansia sp.]